MRRGLIAVATLIATFVPAHAQQGSTPNSRLMFDPSIMQDSRRPAQQPQTTTGQNSVQQQQPASAPQPARPVATQSQAQAPVAAPGPAPKPAAQTTAATQQPPATRRAAPAARSFEQIAPAQTTRSADRPVPREQPNLGRVSLPQGSLGYEGRTQLQSYDMSDGRRVPGYENIQRNDSSYFGLSLRMPTAGSPASSGYSSPSSPSSFGRHGAN